GKFYTDDVLDIIPDGKIMLDEYVGKNINIRNDLFAADGETLEFYASRHKLNILSDKEVDLNLLWRIKPSLICLNFDTKGDISPEYLKNVKKIGVKYQLFFVSRNKEDISNIRLKFFEDDVFVIEPPKKVEGDNLVFKSRKYYISS